MDNNSFGNHNHNHSHNHRHHQQISNRKSLNLNNQPRHSSPPPPPSSSSSRIPLPSSSSSSMNKYELENSVSELFRLFSVTEAKNFNRETISERFEKNLNHQSSKPFSIFFNRLSDNEKFVEQYNILKCQNSKEIDPFVRFMVRVREDKNMSNFMNNYNDIVNNKYKFIQQQQSLNSLTKTKNQQLEITRRLTTPRTTPRPSSATSALLNMVNQNDFNPINYQQNQIAKNANNVEQQQQQQTNNLVKSKTIGTMRVSSKNIKSPLKLIRNHQTPKTMNPRLLSSPMVDHSGGGCGGGGNVESTPDLNDISFTSVASTTATPSTSAKKSSNHHQHHNQNRKVPPYLSKDFHPCDWPKENDCFSTLGTYPVQEQEQLLLRDLLYVLIGIEGRFIRLSQSQDSCHYKLILDPTTDHFFAVTTQRILKICYHYSTIISFVESRVYGLVNQALVSSIQQHLYDYNMTICQMEDLYMKNDLFLQKMFFILLPYFSTFSLLKEICSKLYKNRCVGGTVLTLLHEKTKSIQGMDNNALELCLQLTKSSSIPYFDILKTWIYYGEIGDPRKEFFIEDTHSQQNINSNDHNLNQSISSQNKHNQSSVNNNAQLNNNNNENDLCESDDEYDDDFSKFNDKYWDSRYRINTSKTPCFLRKYEQIIYKTGKYVSIINKVKQLFLKSSKVLPLPQSIFQQQQQNNNLMAANATTTIGSSILPNDGLPSAATSYMPKNYLNTNMNNNHNPMMFNYFGQNMNMNNPLMNDNTSFAYSMASSSSSNASNNSGNTPMQNHHQQSKQQSSIATTIFTPKPEEIYYSFDEQTYLLPIQSAYEEASSQLLHILVHESQLVETFNAVRHYMLLSMGDFIVHFMKFASNDLCKRTDSVVQHRLDSMMGMALGISVCHSDRQYLKDDPHVEFVGKSFLKQIYQLMKPFGDNHNNRNDSASLSYINDASPSSSYLLRCDDDDLDEDELDNDGDVGLNRSIISSVIEDQDYQQQPDNSIDSSLMIRRNRPTKYLLNSNKTSMTANENCSSPSLSSSKVVNKKTDGTAVAVAAGSSSKLFCYESLMLKFDVPFPLSLIFTKKSVVCYELLFRYIFLCRYAEMELEETWKDNILNIQLKRCDTLSLLNHLSSSSSNNPNNNQNNSSEQQLNHAKLLAKSFKSIHKKAFALRYKMIAFVRNFHYFYAFEVIDPSFIQFIQQITKRGSSLDSVIECHEKFLEHCFNSCFLTSLDVTTIIIKIFTLCIELSHLLKDSIDVEDQSIMMESSCFFGNGQLQTKSPTKKSTINKNLAKEFESAASMTSNTSTEDEDDLIQEKLNKIYFANRIFSGVNSDRLRLNNGKHQTTYTIKEIINKANNEFDFLVKQLLNKIYSDNCEYHMMFPFVARLDYNDFYRCQIIK